MGDSVVGDMEIWGDAQLDCLSGQLGDIHPVKRSDYQSDKNCNLHQDQGLILEITDQQVYHC